MKFLPLILRNLLRRKVRTIFTILSIVIAFLLFGVLMAIRAAFSMGVDIAGADRLMVIHRVSIIQPQNDENSGYMGTKRDKLGHLLAS